MIPVGRVKGIDESTINGCYICFREVLGVLVESLAGRLGGVVDAVLRPELLRGATQARELAHGPSAHLTIKILPVDPRLRVAVEDDHALHRHGLLIAPVAYTYMRRVCEYSESGCRLCLPLCRLAWRETR